MASAMTNNSTDYGAQKTWLTGDALTASDMNTYLRDQLAALKTPASFYAYIDEGADYTTTSTSFVSVDTTDLHGAITTAGGKLLVGFSVSISASAALRVAFDILVDGVRFGLDDGLCMHFLQAGNNQATVSYTGVIGGLSAGAHTFELQWKTSTGTATMYAGAGTAAFGDVHPSFWGKESV